MRIYQYFHNTSFKRALLLTTVRVVIPTAILLNSNDMVAEEPKKWRPQIDLNIKYGNKRDIGRIGAFGPIAQTNDMLSFVDFRFMADTRSNQEGNFGLGHRWIDPNLEVIWGGYGYYDRRSSNLGNKYNQLTFGAECLSLTWDYRANVYFPERKVYTKTTTIKNENVGDVTGRGYTKGQPGADYVATQKEVPLKGIDVEVGRAIPGIPSLRLYAGTYYYQGRAGIESINGYHTRTDFEINEYFTIQAEAKRDNVRKNNFYLGVELRIPLGKETAKTRGLTDLEKRMTIAPMRDVDIVANDKTETVIVPTYHVLADNVHYVLPDGEKNGVIPDGTFERPFRDAAEFKKHMESNPNAENAQTLIADHQMHGEIVSKKHFLLPDSIRKIMLMQKTLRAFKSKNLGHSITRQQLLTEMQSCKKNTWTFKKRNRVAGILQLAAEQRKKEEANAANQAYAQKKWDLEEAKHLRKEQEKQLRINSAIKIQSIVRMHQTRQSILKTKQRIDAIFMKTAIGAVNASNEIRHYWEKFNSDNNYFKTANSIKKLKELEEIHTFVTRDVQRLHQIHTQLNSQINKHLLAPEIRKRFDDSFETAKDILLWTKEQCYNTYIQQEEALMAHHDTHSNIPDHGSFSSGSATPLSFTTPLKNPHSNGQPSVSNEYSFDDLDALIATPFSATSFSTATAHRMESVYSSPSNLEASLMTQASGTSLRTPITNKTGSPEHSFDDLYALIVTPSSAASFMTPITDRDSLTSSFSVNADISPILHSVQSTPGNADLNQREFTQADAVKLTVELTEKSIKLLNAHETRSHEFLSHTREELGKCKDKAKIIQSKKLWAHELEIHIGNAIRMIEEYDNFLMEKFMQIKETIIIQPDTLKIIINGFTTITNFNNYEKERLQELPALLMHS